MLKRKAEFLLAITVCATQKFRENGERGIGYNHSRLMKDSERLAILRLLRRKGLEFRESLEGAERQKMDQKIEQIEAEINSLAQICKEEQAP